MSSLKSVLYFVCLFVLSCFLFILPLLISPCSHFWSEFMASRDRLWRDYLKSLFLRGIQVSPRSVTILTFNFFKIPETTLKKVHVPPPVFCLFILVGTVTKTILLHHYFFIKTFLLLFPCLSRSIRFSVTQRRVSQILQHSLWFYE